MSDNIGMPEGYHRLKHCQKMSFANVTESDLELIKAIGEVLEDILQKDQTKTNWTRAYRVLEAFKEWK